MKLFRKARKYSKEFSVWGNVILFCGATKITEIEEGRARSKYRLWHPLVWLIGLIAILLGLIQDTIGSIKEVWKFLIKSHIL